MIDEDDVSTCCGCLRATSGRPPDVKSVQCPGYGQSAVYCQTCARGLGEQAFLRPPGWMGAKRAQP